MSTNIESIGLNRPGGTPSRRIRSWRSVVTALVLCGGGLAFVGFGRQEQDAENAAEARLRETVEYLAADEREGRGPETKGIELSAEYIVKRFDALGLKTDIVDGTPFQEFDLLVQTSPDKRASGVSGLIDWPSIISSLMKKALHKNSGNNDSSLPDRPAQTPTRPIRLKNVIASLEGEGPLAEETVVIGAHYDHLGVGKRKGEQIIYNGANDNASGVAVMLEAARILTQRREKLPRRILFVSFSGEELGLRGSVQYVNHPPLPLEKTIAMICLDIVGRQEGDRLLSLGAETSPALTRITNSVAEQHRINLLSFPVPMAGPFGSDHLPFYSKLIPVVFFVTTGGAADYHQPSDTADTLNYAGMRRIAQYTADIAVALAEAEPRPEFRDGNPCGLVLRTFFRLWGWAVESAPPGIIRLDRQVSRTPQESE